MLDERYSRAGVGCSCSGRQLVAPVRSALVFDWMPCGVFLEGARVHELCHPEVLRAS